MQRTKAGAFFYNFTVNFSHFLTHHLWLWYILNLTWGLPYTLIGTLIYFGVRIFAAKRLTTHRFGPVRAAQFGRNWGGFEAVFFILVADEMSEEYTLHIYQHELGHSFQNALYGPFNIFLTVIPSAIHYWHQEFRRRRGQTNKPYDLIWFEGSATTAGAYASQVLNLNIK